MRCEQARELIPAYLDDALHAAGALEVHLATCADCARVLADYRRMLEELRALRDRGEEPSIELVERILALIPTTGIGARVLGTRVLGSVQAHPVAYAVAGVGSAVVGATAVAAMRWWRRRVEAPAG